MVVLPVHLTVDFNLGYVIIIGRFEVVPRSGVRIGVMYSLSLGYPVTLVCVASLGVGVVFSNPIGVGSDRDSRRARVAGSPYPADGKLKLLTRWLGVMVATILMLSSRSPVALQ